MHIYIYTYSPEDRETGKSKGSGKVPARASATIILLSCCIIVYTILLTNINLYYVKLCNIMLCYIASISDARMTGTHRASRVTCDACVRRVRDATWICRSDDTSGACVTNTSYACHMRVYIIITTCYDLRMRLPCRSRHFSGPVRDGGAGGAGGQGAERQADAGPRGT